MWTEGEEYPDDLKLFALNTGTVLSNLQPESVTLKAPDKVEVVPVQFFKTNYNNSLNEAKYTATFEGIMSTSTSVTGTWERENEVSVENMYGVEIELTEEFEFVSFDFKAAQTTKWEQTTKRSSKTAVGGGTTTLSTTTLRQNCVVDVPAKTNLEVTANFFRGRYPLTYEGDLRFVSETRGAPAILIHIKGKFDVSVDTLQTWWDVGQGTFISKSTPTPQG
jgi:hypothetical protein